jgi:hypothetical protein
MMVVLAGWRIGILSRAEAEYLLARLTVVIDQTIDVDDG